MSAPDSAETSDWTPVHLEEVLQTRLDALKTHERLIAKDPTSKLIGERTVVSSRAVARLRDAMQTEGPRLEISQSVLGTGGMSVVTLGHQRALDRPVAVKALRDDFHDEQSEMELLQEAWITGRLEHPQVVPVYDVSTDSDGRPLIVLKRIEGESWFALIRDEQKVRDSFGVEDPLRWHLHVFMQVCNAVHFAHSRGVVHRDLKPENIMVGPFEEVYVVDWGIAVVVDGSGPEDYEPDQLAGTPVYMAPEMVLGDPVTVQTDVYLLGACLFHLLNDRPPHQGRTLKEIARSSLVSEPSFEPFVDPELAAICRHAMARDAEHRYVNADALRRAVLEYLERRSSRALVREALEDLETLEALGQGSSDEGDLPRAYDLYGACRFGFRAALRSWPDNPDAREGLNRAVRVMVRLEVQRKNALGAAALIRELDDPPPELLAEVDNALAARDVAREEVQRLRRFHQDFDPGFGRRGRWMVAWVLLLVFGPMPLILQVLQGARYDSHSIGFTTPAIYLSLTAVLIFWRRKELMRNRFNRVVSFALLFVFAAELVFSFGQWIAGVDPVLAHLQDFGIIGTGVTMFSFFVEPRLAIGGLAYFAAYLVSSAYPELRFWMLSAANTTTMAVAVWCFRPSEESAKNDSDP